MLSQRLKECRKLKSVTQKDIANFLGISERAYQHYELSTREPNNETLLKLAEYFDVTTDYLLGRSATPN